MATVLVAGGEFTQAGGVPVNHVAGWDGAHWAALGAGTDGPVRAVASMGNGAIAVGGTFSHAGDVAAHNVAVWDGTAWAALGEGTDDTVQALVGLLGGARLVAAGRFRAAGANADGTTGAALWDGAAWTSLGAGGSLDGDGLALALLEGETVVVGGRFSRAGGVAAANVAQWSPATGAWTALGGGCNFAVLALTVYDGRVLAGGGAGADGAAPQLLQWDGVKWAPLGSTATAGLDGDVAALLALSGQLYAAGRFTHAGGAAAHHVAAWDGAAWASLASGVNHHAAALVEYNGGLVVGGHFTTAGGAAAASVARWPPWAALGTDHGSFDGAVLALATLATTEPSPTPTPTLEPTATAPEPTVEPTATADPTPTVEPTPTFTGAPPSPPGALIAVLAVLITVAVAMAAYYYFVRRPARRRGAALFSQELTHESLLPVTQMIELQPTAASRNGRSSVYAELDES